MTLLFYNGKLLADGDCTISERNINTVVTFVFNVFQNDVVQLIKIDGLSSHRKAVSLDSNFSAGQEVTL